MFFKLSSIVDKMPVIYGGIPSERSFSCAVSKNLQKMGSKRLKNIFRFHEAQESS